MVNNYITLILNFLYKVKSGTLWQDIRDSERIQKRILEFVTKYFGKVNNC